jgi:hypothetical protein
MSFFRRLLKKDVGPAGAQVDELQLVPPEPDPGGANTAPGSSSYVGILQTPGSPALDDDWNSGVPAKPTPGDPALDDDWNNKDGSPSHDGPGEVMDSNPDPPNMDGAILVVGAADGPMPDLEDDPPDELSRDPPAEAVARDGAIIGADFDFNERSTLVRLDPTDFEGDGPVLVGFSPAESLDSGEPDAFLAEDHHENSEVDELPDI